MWTRHHSAHLASLRLRLAINRALQDSCSSRAIAVCAAGAVFCVLALQPHDAVSILLACCFGSLAVPLFRSRCSRHTLDLAPLWPRRAAAEDELRPLWFSSTQRVALGGANSIGCASAPRFDVRSLCRADCARTGLQRLQPRAVSAACLIPRGAVVLRRRAPDARCLVRGGALRTFAT